MRVGRCECILQGLAISPTSVALADTSVDINDGRHNQAEVRPYRARIDDGFSVACGAAPAFNNIHRLPIIHGSILRIYVCICAATWVNKVEYT